MIIEELPNDSDEQQKHDNEIPPVTSKVPVESEEEEEWVKVDHIDANSSKDREDEDDLAVLEEKINECEKLKVQGNAFFAEGDLDIAMAKYTEAIDLAPQHSSTSKQRAIYYANRAACHLRIDDAADAVEDCTKALDLDPTYVRALVRRSSAFEALEEYDAALQDAQKVLKDFDENNQAAKDIVLRVEPIVLKKQEEMKEEMVGKLKELGNSILGKFGMSIDNFKAEKDPETGSYSIKFNQ